MRKLAIEDFFNLFLLISAIHGFVFCIAIFFSKNGQDKSMQFLNLLVLVISLNNFQSWVLAKHFFSTYLALDYINIPFHFLIAPFFHLFLLHYLKITDRYKNILTFILPVFSVIVFIRCAFIYVNSELNYEKNSYLFQKYTVFEEIASLVVSLFLFGYSYHILSKKEKLFSTILSFDNLKWIYTFFKLGSIAYLFWTVAIIVSIYLNFTELIYSYYPLRILTSILIYWIGYQGFMRIKVINERVIIRSSLTAAKKTETPYFNTLKEGDLQVDKQNQFNKIHTYIIENKRFTDANITLESLAEELQISSSLFSLLINNYAHKKFPDYINELRVEQAKKLFSDTNYSNYTAISIGLESGFNSKSTFYTVFKKHTNITPVAYRKGLPF